VDKIFGSVGRLRDFDPRGERDLRGVSDLVPFRQLMPAVLRPLRRRDFCRLWSSLVVLLGGSGCGWSRSPCR
jgi:hypothetical protein